MGGGRAGNNKKDPLPPLPPAREVGRGLGPRHVPRAPSAAVAALPGCTKGCRLGPPDASALALDSLMAAPRAGRGHRRPAPAAAAAAAPGGGRPVTAPSQSAPRRCGGVGGHGVRTADTAAARAHARTHPPAPSGAARAPRPAPRVHTWTEPPRPEPESGRHRDTVTRRPTGGVPVRTHTGEPSTCTRTLTRMTLRLASEVPRRGTRLDAHTLVSGQRLRDPLRGKLRRTFR